tara:strand:+ start:79981 stop:81549 length:1569 start_codon:yes stop_codon:yes gene_type:complete
MTFIFNAGYLIRRILLVSLGLLLLTTCIRREDENNVNLPHIIVILADDLGYGDLEVYNPGSKIPTPNLNALAASGMRFTDAHSPSSVCTPTRYGILTGRYAWRTALKKSVLWAWDKPLIEDDRVTLPKTLKGVGYQTACIGKWHLGWRWPANTGGFINDDIAMGDYNLEGRNELWHNIDFTKQLGGGPLAAGFDYYFGDDVPNFAPYAFIENDRLLNIPDTIKPNGIFGGPGPMVTGWDLAEVMPAITQNAMKYIREQASKESPFFLYFPLTAPHTPIAPAEEFIGKSTAGRYGDYVHQVDYTVGQILQVLEQTGQLENTIVIFTSDNGSPQRDGENMAGKVGSVKAFGHDPSYPLRGTKSDIWEGGHRVPLIVSWPDKIDPGQVTNQLFGLNDLMATLAGLIGIEAGSEFKDSEDLSEVLLTHPNQPIRDHLIHHSIQGMFSIRKGPWKLIAGKGSGGWSANTTENDAPGQLYNLDDDLGETTNLYNEYPEIVEELLALLGKYQDQGFSNSRFRGLHAAED